jgi:DNA mismatch endonuclease (patch repair protein)
MDVVDKQTRSKMMANIKGKNTKPEIVVRSLLHRQGFRFRIHDKSLPGTPDIVLKKYKTAIFVQGCYWHRHENCKLASMPKQNNEFWTKKFNATLRRDGIVYFKLKQLGWRVSVIWECATRDKVFLPEHIKTLVTWLKSECEYIEIPEFFPEADGLEFE